MIFSKEELPVTQFSLLGVNLQDPFQMPPSELALLMQGRRTTALKCKPTFLGESKDVSFQARLNLSRDDEGKAILKFHPRRIEPENNFSLTHSQMQELKAQPDMPVMAVVDDKIWSVYLDTQTNELLGLNLDFVRAPLTINGQRLTEEQEMRFRLGETISLSNPDGRETVLRLDPFQKIGVIARNLDSLEIELGGSLTSLQYKGRQLIDNDYLLQQELGGLIILEEVLKQRLTETDPIRMGDLEQFFAEAKEEILYFKATHGGHINSEEIATILSRHLSSAGIPFSASLESLIPSETESTENNSSDETGGDENEKIEWLTNSKNIDGAGNLMMESSIGATIIGILSAEERENFTLAIKKVQESLESQMERLTPTQLQEKMLVLLREQLGSRLVVYQKDSQLKVSETIQPQKQQPNISQ